MNFGLHILKTPTGRYSYVGTLPTVLAFKVPATRAGMLGGYAWKENGEYVEWKFPSFDTEQEARDFAASHGCKVTP